jgi:electron transfer flavoprotein beta subunit
MNIVVCVKQIIDPEIRPEQFKLDPATKRQVRGELSLVISAYDQNALEVALQLKEKVGGKVTALCLGEPDATGAVKSAMGMGVEAGVLVTDPVLRGSDSFGVAYALALAIQKLGVPDLILTGCVSGDTGTKAVGPLLAEALRLPYLTFVTRLELQEGRLRARRILEDGYEVVETTLPAVCTVLSDDHNVPRYSKLKDIMAASRKTVTVWGVNDLGLDPGKVGAINVRLPIGELVIPQRESHCELITGETPEEQVARLVAELRAQKVL